MRDILGPTLFQFAVQSPVLLVYLGAIYLALSNWNRHPSPSLLTLIAACVLLLFSIAHPLLVRYLIERRNDMGQNWQQLEAVLASVGLFGSIIHALGIGTLLAAVYVGREKSDSSAWEE